MIYGTIWLVVFVSSSALIGLVSPAYSAAEYLCLLVALLFLFIHSAECVELAAALVLPRRYPPRLLTLDRRPRVALLYLTCNDFCAAALASLARESYENADLFMLDDGDRSFTDRYLPAGAAHLRRETRRGAKAGNLNDWLRSFSAKYDYVLICDADTILAKGTVDEMLRYAEHPQNADIAIFDTLITPWNHHSPLCSAQEVEAYLRHEIQLRLESRLDVGLCAGHNMLVRVPALLEVGGFAEDFTAEDYATAVRLRGTGRWRCTCLPIFTYERCPPSVKTWVRRERRWTTQTLQLLKIEMGASSPDVYFRLIRALCHYLKPALSILWVVMLTAVLISDRGFSSVTLYRNPSSPGMSWWAMGLVIWLFTPDFLRWCVLCRSRIGTGRIVASSLIGLLLGVAAIGPLLLAALAAVRGHKVDFRVTGPGAPTSAGELLALSWFGAIICGATSILGWVHWGMQVFTILFGIGAVAVPMLLLCETTRQEE